MKEYTWSNGVGAGEITQEIAMHKFKWTLGKQNSKFFVLPFESTNALQNVFDGSCV